MIKPENTPLDLFEFSLFYCEPLRARLSVTACAKQYRYAHTEMQLGMSPDRMHAVTAKKLSPCIRCSVGEQHARGDTYSERKFICQRCGAKLNIAGCVCQKIVFPKPLTHLDDKPVKTPKKKTEYHCQFCGNVFVKLNSRGGNKGHSPMCQQCGARHCTTREVKCDTCGQEFKRDAAVQRVCWTCRNKVLLAREVQCYTCKKPFVRTDLNQKRCPSCLAKKAKRDIKNASRSVI